MLRRLLTRVKDLPPWQSDACWMLCRQGSEMQHEFATRQADTPLMIVTFQRMPIAWTASHRWRDMQTLEGFTHVAHRRKGAQRLAASGLVEVGVLKLSQPVAVFARECLTLTRSLGFLESRLYLRDAYGEWVQQGE